MAVLHLAAGHGLTHAQSINQGHAGLHAWSTIRYVCGNADTLAVALKGSCDMTVGLSIAALVVETLTPERLTGRNFEEYKGELPN